MRPYRIVIGEVRGPEALDLLTALNTGHDGSLSTVHANSPRDAIARLETLVVMAGMDLPPRAMREEIASAARGGLPGAGPSGGGLRLPAPRAARRPPPRHPRDRGAGHGGRDGDPAGRLP